MVWIWRSPTLTPDTRELLDLPSRVEQKKNAQGEVEYEE